MDLAVTELLSPDGTTDSSTTFIKAVTSDAIALLDGDALLTNDRIFRTAAGARSAALDHKESHGNEKETTT
jgi:hypothetical protein